MPEQQTQRSGQALYVTSYAEFIQGQRICPVENLEDDQVGWRFPWCSSEHIHGETHSFESFLQGHQSMEVQFISWGIYTRSDSDREVVDDFLSRTRVEIGGSRPTTLEALSIPIFTSWLLLRQDPALQEPTVMTRANSKLNIILLGDHPPGS